MGTAGNCVLRHNVREEDWQEQGDTALWGTSAERNRPDGGVPAVAVTCDRMLLPACVLRQTTWALGALGVVSSQNGAGGPLGEVENNKYSKCPEPNALGRSLVLGCVLCACYC